MNAPQRAAVVRVLIDLIKADKVIDMREMQLYNEIKTQLAITRLDEVSAHELTLAEAVRRIRTLTSEETELVLRLFDDMTLSDGYCAREEALLMLALHFCLRDRAEESCVISCEVDSMFFADSQVLYVESSHNRTVNAEINEHFREIAIELRLHGFELVYLPRILKHYLALPKADFADVISILSPDYNADSIQQLISQVRLLKTDTFCREHLAGKLGFHELCDTDPALMLRIGQSRVEGRVVANFLKIEATSTVLELVRSVIDELQRSHQSDLLVISNKRQSTEKFLYAGFYRQLFEILLLRRQSEATMQFDLVEGAVGFPAIGLRLSSLHRKEKAFYMLFALEAGRGGINFNAPESAREFEGYERRMAQLRQRYARIYQSFGGVAEKAPDITVAEIRLPMLSGIKRSLMRVADRVADVERFVISRDRNGFYGLSASPVLFRLRDFSHPDSIPLADSELARDVNQI